MGCPQRQLSVDELRQERAIGEHDLDQRSAHQAKSAVDVAKALTEETPVERPEAAREEQTEEWVATRRLEAHHQIVARPNCRQ